MTTSARGRALLALALLAMAAYLVGLWRDWPALRLGAKPVPVLCLVACVLGRATDPYRLLVAAGLALSAAGDALLEFPRLFVAGLTAFLCAHLCYIAAFLTETRRPALWRALPFVVWLVLVYVRIRGGLDGMAGPVTAYVIVIGIMMWRAAARVGATAPSWFAPIGAVLFGMSDTLIGLDRFHAPIPGSRYPIGLLYWAGQAGIALSARRPDSPPAHR